MPIGIPVAIAAMAEIVNNIPTLMADTPITWGNWKWEKTYQGALSPALKGCYHALKGEGAIVHFLYRS